MNDPFKIEELTVISFSGGRTSGYLLWRVLQANGGLPKNCRVVFQNTGEEHEQTLEFVRDVGIKFGVDIYWLEYKYDAPHFKIVNFETASRKGEPFDELCYRHDFLPNSLNRFCTQHLKVKTMSHYIKSLGVDEIQNWVGIRFDEKRRWDNVDGIQYKKYKTGEFKTDKHGQRMPLNTIIVEEKYAPLRYARITEADVLHFWKNYDFNLKLDPKNSNCTLCFHKPKNFLINKIRSNPGMADRWIEREEKVKGGKHTYLNGVSYSKLKELALDNKIILSDYEVPNTMPCNCTD